MYELTVPDDITIDPPAPLADALRRMGCKVPDTFSFLRHALECWLGDPRAVQAGFVKQVRWTQVVMKFMSEGAIAQNTMLLEDEDFEVLKTIVQRPSSIVSPLLGMFLLPFSQSVIDAKKVDFAKTGKPLSAG